MAPTTATAVREELVSLITALVPTTLAVEAVDRFKRYHSEKPWREWAAGNLANCFRWFDLRFDQPSDQPPVTNGDVEHWRYPFTLEVAYPRVHYRTIDVPVIEMDQVQDEDQKQLILVLREQTTNATWIKDGASFERDVDGEVSFLVFKAKFEIYRQMT